ncbi:helix-turn-helix domain-containing protein [Phenylobacterium sp.]|uniref:helix-turn-helix domain-containing protein n=1 Tax=Phenylobacterium sp. TaxID=1871053 RepID=UPI00374D1C6E
MPFAPRPATPPPSTVLPFDRKRFELGAFEPAMSQAGDAVARAIGKRIRRRRRELGATLAEIARRAGVSYQQVQRFECGETQISAAMVWKLAAALGVGVHDLFGEDGPAGPSPSGKTHRSAPPAAG